MLAQIGGASIDELFAQIPDEVRLDRPLNLPDGMGESEVYRFLAGLADTNLDAERIPSFLGAGMYDHYVPAIVDAIISRSEFLTPYTPYQPEVSQGGLQVMFEFQTAMSEITGLPVSNAGLYEGPSAAASAAYPASKAALNMLTIQYAKQLRDTPILVNAAAPGACATDFTVEFTRVTGRTTDRTAEQGAAIAIRLATLDDGGPTGGFFDDDGPVPW